MEKPMKVFDAILEMRFSALREGETPRRWEINHAAKMSLLMDERYFRIGMDTTVCDQPLFNIPVTVTGDRSEDPKISLVVEEREEGRCAPKPAA